MSSNLRVIVTGLIAQHPQLGGVTWDYLQYVVGLKRLGHDVYYFEDSGEWTYNTDGGASGNDWIAYDPSANVNHLAEVMQRFGLGNKWAYHFPIKSRWYGLSTKKRREILSSADLLINVSGTLKRPADYRQIPRLVYIDSDPVFTQVKLNLRHGQKKFQKRLAVHDRFFSFGECLPAKTPTTGHNWLPTRQPIILSEWQPAETHKNVYTTVMSWTSYKPLSYLRQTYGQKDVEFKRFLELPAKVSPVKMEVAMGNSRHVKWERNGKDVSPEIRRLLTQSGGQIKPRDLLCATGWQVADATVVSRDLDGYRDYIQTSKGEWSVAKNGYVAGESGWFSCRSACYLAAGRPVIVQDTGFSKILPVGEGLLAFKTLNEAADAVRQVEGDYKRHSRAARGIAERYFDSDKVLSKLISEAMN